MADIFVSYAHKDFEIVNKVMHDLHDLGFEYWMDRKDLQGGDPWSAEIAKALADASMLLLFVSSASMESSYVLHEVQTAFKQRKRVIVLRLEETMLHPQLEGRLSTIQWIDHHTHTTEWLARLAIALRGMVEVPDSPKALGFVLQMGLGFLLPIFGCLAINIIGASKYFLQDGWLPSAEQVITTSIAFLALLLIAFAVFMIGLEKVTMVAIGKVTNFNWSSAIQTTWQFVSQTFADREAFQEQALRFWAALKSMAGSGLWNDSDFKDRIKAVIAGILPGAGLYLRGRGWWGLFFLVITFIGYSELFPGILLHLTSLVLTAVLDRPKKKTAEAQQFAEPS